MTINAPNLIRTISGYSVEFVRENITVNLERVTDDGNGEITVIHHNGIGDTLLLPRRSVNLLADRTMSSLASRLKQRLDIDWQTIIDYSCHYVLEETRTAGVIENIDEPPNNSKLEYLLYPILVKNQPTTIFSPGGFGKSTLADFIAVSVQYGLPVLNWRPEQGNVLYLDWESDSETHKRYIQAIKSGLNITDNTTIRYLRCEIDLVKIIDYVYKIVVDNNISLVIIDSQMAASATGRPGADASQLSQMYHNALRSLKCTSLTIDHVSKQAMGELNAVNPYGSISKANRARSQFELKQHQDAGEDTIELALFHTKTNLGKKLKPAGIRIDYFNDGDRLDEIRFSSFEVTDNPELSKSLTIKERLVALLKGGPVGVKEIAEYLDKDEASVRTTLNRYKHTFINIDGDWGLLDNN